MHYIPSPACCRWSRPATRTPCSTPPTFPAARATATCCSCSAVGPSDGQPVSAGLAQASHQLAQAHIVDAVRAQCALGFDHIVQARARMAHRVAHRRQQAVVADVGRVFLAGAVEQEHHRARALPWYGRSASAGNRRPSPSRGARASRRPSARRWRRSGRPPHGNSRLDPGRTPGRDCPASRDDRATTGKGTGDSRAPSPAAARARQSRDARSGNRRQRPRDHRCRSNRSGDRPPTPRAGPGIAATEPDRRNRRRRVLPKP